ncbi:hypothetical protein INT44_001503 [Umbelopsis vinacea]|uniref:Uncharacterized protein n=1 Tax=Umbelopsis vinacea TaxID=44442 RepID=A0A8H7PQK0_9FUNG|nr:hypothetical protein INT44_001503 [Umbelopsis vinacea]
MYQVCLQLALGSSVVPPRPTERAAFGSALPSNFTMFSFGALTEGSLDEPTNAQMQALEDMTFCNYQSCLTELAESRVAERGPTAGSSSRSSREIWRGMSSLKLQNATSTERRFNGTSLSTNVTLSILFN